MLQKTLAVNVLKEISPCRVLLFDQVEFPAAVPVLYLLFTGDGVCQPVVMFDKHKPVEVIAAGKAGEVAGPVFGHATGDVPGDADIKCPVPAVRQDVCPG